MDRGQIQPPSPGTIKLSWYTVVPVPCGWPEAHWPLQRLNLARTDIIWPTEFKILLWDSLKKKVANSGLGQWTEATEMALTVEYTQVWILWILITLISIFERVKISRNGRRGKLSEQENVRNPLTPLDPMYVSCCPRVINFSTANLTSTRGIHAQRWWTWERP